MVSLWLVKESYWPFKIEISNEHDFAVYIETHFCIDLSKIFHKTIDDIVAHIVASTFSRLEPIYGTSLIAFP